MAWKNFGKPPFPEIGGINGKMKVLTTLLEVPEKVLEVKNGKVEIGRRVSLIWKVRFKSKSPPLPPVRAKEGRKITPIPVTFWREPFLKILSPGPGGNPER